MTQPTPDTQYSLEQVADLAGVNARTVRYYIQLGLVDRPIGETRAAHYNWQHLKQLLQVRGYTQQGFSLERIGELMRGDDTVPLPATVARPGSISVQSHIHLAPGIDLVVDPSQAGWTPEQLRRFAREAVAVLRRISNEQD